MKKQEKKLDMWLSFPHCKIVEKVLGFHRPQSQKILWGRGASLEVSLSDLKMLEKKLVEYPAHKAEEIIESVSKWDNYPEEIWSEFLEYVREIITYLRSK